MSSDEQAPVESSHQSTEFPLAQDEVMQADAFTGGQGSNFISTSASNDYEEEKLMRDVSINQVPNNFFEANGFTRHPFENQPYSM